MAIRSAIRPNDEQRSGLLALPEILEGTRVKVPAGVFPDANLRLLESLGVIVSIKPAYSGRGKDAR